MPSRNDKKDSVRSPGDEDLDHLPQHLEQPLNPRIVKGLNRLYDDIINDPIPDKISSVLERLREEERAQTSGRKADADPDEMDTTDANKVKARDES